MSSDRVEPGRSSDPQRLNGWKEIAAYVGNVEVRTVQRWEVSRGLPVRRQPGENRSLVFALKHEIDAWQQQGEIRKIAKDLSTPPADQFVAATELANASAQKRSWQRSALAVLLVLIAIGPGSIPIVRSRYGEVRQPTTAIIDRGSLVALDANDARLWAQPLGFEPVLEQYENPSTSVDGMKRLFVTDLDNDGVNEVILAIASVGVKGAQGYRVFDSEGRPRFTVEPSDQVTFGDQTYSGPWSVYRMFVIENPDGTRSIWASFIHSLYFPTMLLEVNPEGRIVSKYWSNGYVEQIEVATIGDRRRVLVGATHNDTRGASLAVFEYGMVFGSAPAALDRFKCRTCEPGGPESFIVFPRQCIAEVLAGQAAVQFIRFDAAGRIFAYAGEGTRNHSGEFEAGVWYTIEPVIGNSSMQLTPGTSALHRRLEKEGRLKHAFADPLHLSSPKQILRWDVTRFTPVDIANLTPGNIAP